jgi:hypothetical protein
MCLARILGKVTCAEAAAPGSKTTRSKALKFKKTSLKATPSKPSTPGLPLNVPERERYQSLRGFVSLRAFS